MKSKKVFILGDIGLDKNGGFHFGDEAMFLANLKWYKGDNFSVCGSSRSISHKGVFDESLDMYIKGCLHYYFLLCLVYLQKFLKINLLPISFRKTFYSIISSDVVHISGGGNSNEIWPGHVFYRSLVINIAYLHKIPVYISGQTIGKFRRYLLSHIFYSAVTKAKIIGVRDNIKSRKYLTEANVPTEKIHFCPDDILLLKGQIKTRASVCKEHKMKVVRIGLSIHKFDELDLYGHEISKLLTEVVMRFRSASFHIVPHYYNKIGRGDDLDYARIILSTISAANTTAPTYKSLQSKDFESQILDVLSESACLDFIITTRYHGAVAGFLRGVPVFMLNLNDYYRQKHEGLCDGIGLDKNLFLYDLKSIKPVKVVENISFVLSNIENFQKQIIVRVFELIDYQNDFYERIKNENYTA